MISAPKVTISVKKIVGSGLEMYNLDVLQELVQSDTESPIDLTPLKLAPKLQRLEFRNCSGLTPSKENFDTLNLLQTRGVAIVLSDMPGFQEGYAAYRHSNVVDNTLPQTMASLEKDQAVLQNTPSDRTQSSVGNLPTYTSSGSGLHQNHP
jgi:hypothetical protein